MDIYEPKQPVRRMSAASQPPTRFDDAAWFTSTASAAQNECVEVNTGTGAVIGAPRLQGHRR